ncbi:choline-sulfatase [Diplogelasinospora grovesii]|uniref:Choline-sulfatase n=1 Tax=Diplogelasinospora grovesii TaxID=303347 RepID=A0AAN6MWU2_9PEZI|nr:choline-sulfatase [Diplogelasinospora grovesii]
MDAVKSALQPITHNLPAPIRDLGVSIIGEKCYRALILDIDHENTECVKLAISKGLGIGIIAASSIVKVPQILKLVNSQSASGVSFLSYLLETSSYLISLAYNVRNGFPFSTFGETALILGQNVIICGLVLNYSGKQGMAALFVAALAASAATLFAPNLVDMQTLAYLQAGAGVLGVASKVPQIAAIWQQGGTGQLSAFAVFNYLIGSLSRIFTTLQEVDDKLILYGFIAGFALNLVLAAQMVYYWNAPSAKAKGKQKEKMPIAAPAAKKAQPPNISVNGGLNGNPNGANGHGNGNGVSPQTQKRPNILYIMADQLAAPLLKMYNDKSQILTPNLDKLASRSVQFDSAYCPSPLCAPSRMSMITGLLPVKIGAYDNAAQIGSDVPTYAHYLRLQGYHTVLAGKMHFVGDQLHGYETRLTSDIYPGDFGWVVNWDQPDTRLEWYHNASSILQAGVCVRSNQLDYDEEVMYRAKQYMYDHVREGPDARPFCLTVSLTHPHDPYTIEQKYWDLYEGVDIELPKVRIPKEDQDPHSKRLMKVCDLWDEEFSDEQIKRARRAYYGAVSYVDDCVGKLLDVLKQCRLDDNTIIIFSGDHGDMLGERGLWYKMSYFESSVRVPLLVSYPQQFQPRRVTQNVSTLDILPTMCDLVGTKPVRELPMDGVSLLPHLQGREGHDTVFAEYTGEGTVSPLMMIKRGPWKYIICPADGSQLFNLESDPLELHDLAKSLKKKQALSAELSAEDKGVQKIFEAFEAEAHERWDFKRITEDVLYSQRKRRLVWGALRKGHFTSWDYNPQDDGREKYIRSHIPLDDLERRARYPAVDAYGRETGSVKVDQAGSHGQ